MPHNRFFVDAPLTEHAQILLEGEEWQHLRVSRIRTEETVELVNGKNQLATATVTALKKHAAELLIDRVQEAPVRQPTVIIAAAISRMHHLEWTVEKATELGASALWLFPGLFSERDALSEKQQDRLKHLSIAAVKQCGRLDLPEIVLKPPLLKWEPPSGTLLFGDLSKEAPYLWNVPFSKPLSTPVIFFIGPEKGFDPKERSCLLNSLNAKAVRLHPNTLRTETAPLAALCLLQTII